MPRAVVTGGVGFIGSALSARLISNGYEVVCLDNQSTSVIDNVAHLRKFDKYSNYSCDVTEQFQITGKVDVVVHLASPASPIDYAKLPIETLKAGSIGTFNCLHLARAKGARFILASTSEVYGDPLINPQPESYWGNVNPIGARSMYDEAKRFAEALTVSYSGQFGIDVGIARIFNCYGPRMRPDDGRAVPTFMSQALKGAPLTVAGDGSQTRSLCFVDDLVEGLVRLMQSNVTGPINLGNPQEVTITELANLVRSVTNSNSLMQFIDRPPDDPNHRCPDITRARQALGWEPVIGLLEGLEITANWFRSVLSQSRP